jgi:transposase
LRAVADRLHIAVVNTVSAAQAQHGYVFAKSHAQRITLLVHDGFSVWRATRLLYAGRFAWSGRSAEAAVSSALQLSAAQFAPPWWLGCPGNTLASAASARSAEQLASPCG